ncbi:MAG: ParB/RepB/Spo0J family partition protein [Alistipes sp.]|nr:ParB/RepB/Spo0J family partition protein [Candidatus Alistipes equi]
MANKNALGRGLDAIFSQESITRTSKPLSGADEISISSIRPNPQQPRKDFDEDSLQELADSIHELGIIQPVTLRKDQDGYLIISGERRWRAAKIAGLKSIPAYVREVDDDNLNAMAIVENIQREDLNALEIAMGMQRLVDECNMTQEELAQKLGKKRSSVANYLRLLKLPEEIQKALREGCISMGHAKVLASVEQNKKQLSLLQKCIKEQLSVRELEKIIEKSAKPQAPVPQEEDYPEQYTRLIECLEKHFTQDISVRRTKQGGGQIVIKFNSDDDINSIIEKLSF